jgi:excisionase family DNA binding protein
MVAAAKTLEPLLLTARQAAESLGVSEVTLRRLTKAGELPAVQIGFGAKRLHVHYDVADLRAWIDRAKRCAVNTTAPLVQCPHAEKASCV